MKYIIANWKAQKNLSDVHSWIEAFKSYDLSIIKNTHVVLCPPYPFITLVSEAFKDNQSFSIGAQDLSSFAPGKYTGEVTAHSLSGLVTFVIIGHSERRNFLKETPEILAQKADRAAAASIKSIFCIRGPQDAIPTDVPFIAYEPVGAIGSGKNASIEEILSVKSMITLPPQSMFIYGGSANQHDIESYMSSDEIDGVLVGTASLDPTEFYALIEGAERSLS